MCYSIVIHNSLNLTIDLGLPFDPVINLFLYALIEIGLAASSFPPAINKLRCCRPRARGRELIKMVGGMREGEKYGEHLPQKTIYSTRTESEIIWTLASIFNCVLLTKMEPWRDPFSHRSNDNRVRQR